jgi:hypothetical protein
MVSKRHADFRQKNFILSPVTLKATAVIMTKEFILQVLIITGVAIFYLFFTSRYFLSLRQNIIFTGKIKAFHLFMIWVVPFLWILILKALTKSAPGSYEIENKADAEPFSHYGNNMWTEVH